MRILIVICALVIAGLIGFMKLSQLSGEGAQAIFEAAGYEIKIPFMGFLLIALIGFVVLYFFFRLLGGLFRTPKRVGEWNQTRNQKTAQHKLGTGFLALMKGDWKKAEKQLLAKTQYTEVPFVNFLAAAQAAQEQGKYDKRNEYLAKALEKAPNDSLAINMTRARLDQQIGKSDDALKALLDVEDLGRRNPQYVAMLAQAYDELDENEKLAKLLPEAKRLGALPEAVIAEMQAEMDLEKFTMAEDKESAWKETAKTSRKDPDFVAAYAEFQIQKGRVDVAEKLISSTLKTTWDDELVNMYGRIQSTNRKKYLRQVDGWLLARPENAELHLAAGRLAAQDKDTERAQQEFEEAIKLGGLTEAFEELGLLHESEQDLRKALALYRSGLASANGAHSIALEQLQKVSEDEKSQDKESEKDTKPEVKEGELISKSDA